MNEDERRQLDTALARLASGDRSAFDQAFALLEPVLSRFVRKAMAADPDCDDAAQNTLLRVFGRISDYRPGTDALSWVLTLAAYEVATLRKRSHRTHARLESAEALATVAASDDVEGAALERETLERLRQALNQLGPFDQQVLLASPDGPQAPRQRKQKQRALDRLRNLWRALNGDD